MPYRHEPTKTSGASAEVPIGHSVGARRLCDVGTSRRVYGASTRIDFASMVTVTGAREIRSPSA